MSASSTENPTSGFAAWRAWFFTSLNRFIPDGLDPDARRRAQLFVAFSLQGVVFGSAFGGFYFLIDHPWGALVVLVCTAAMAGAPWIVRTSGLERAGNIYAGVLVAGFGALTAMEGGLHGHAVAWLAVVPLCTCILVDQAMGWRWCAVCLTIMLGFCALEFGGYRLQPFYPARWEETVTVAGYLSLTIFMATIGIFFERGRRRSFNKLRVALDALAEANARLAHVDQERKAFLGIAAHDLRNPLNSIMGFAQLMYQFNPPTDPMHLDAVQRIYNGGQRMRDLLDRLLSSQAIEEGRLRLNIQACDLVVLAGSAVENHRIAAAAKEISLELHAGKEPCLVKADREATVQALDNLISNAIKFSPHGRPVIVSVLSDDDGQTDQSRVEVCDAGPGLSEEDQAKLGGKFVRLTAQPTAGESSTGLGLSIVKRLAEAMGGEFGCRSKLGEGSTFSFVLPRSGEARPTGL